IKKHATTAAIALGKPFGQANRAVSVLFSSITLFFREKDALLSENDALQKELKLMQASAALFRERLDEYEELNKIFSLASKEAIVARVLPSPPSLFFDTILINKGMNDGIARGMEVYYGDIFVGFVEEVFGGYSFVSLVSDFKKQTPIRLGELQTNVIGVGLGNGVMIIDFPRDFPIKTGERVLYIGNILALVGFIESIEQEESRATIQARARIPYNPRELSFVTIYP
ncbi:MAG: rod shape-determining protein MreC, partial [Candidatus Niyogibacteria bacterium]|nr:rod shape-determining protein MreC [Candidatus Niyogibacteria bacterium]